MAEHRHLDNPPIKEALIDFRVSHSTDVSVEQLGEIHERFRTNFPTCKPIRVGEFSLHFESSEEEHPRAVSKHSLLGFRYESADGSKVAQFRLNGFTYSRVGGYSNWEEMRDEARALWAIFAEVIAADVVTRVATRFINVLPVPMTGRDLENFLTAPPQIPESLPQALRQFVTRIVVPVPDLDATAIVTQALEMAEPERLPIVLDIDVFVEGNFDAGSTVYWDRLELLRGLKNDIFFASVTNELLELCQ